MKKKTYRNTMMWVLNNKAVILTIIMLMVSVILTSGTALGSHNITGVMRQISVLAFISLGYTLSLIHI